MPPEAEVLPPPVVPSSRSLAGPEGGELDRPLSPGQRALWFLQELAPESGAYVIAAASRVLGELDVPALARALQVLVDRHAALRTTFHDVSGEPVRRVHARLPVAPREVDGRDWRPEEVARRLGREAYRPFDLEAGPPLRVDLVRLGEGRLVLCLSVHHLVADLWSLGVVARDLSRLYRAFRETGSPPRLPPPETDYDEHVRSQWELLASDRAERLGTFWESELAGRPDLLPLPTDRRRPPRPSYRGRAVAFDLGIGIGDRLRRLGRARRATPFAVYLAAFAAVLHRLGAGDDLVIGTPTTGRGPSRLSEVVGYFVNPVPVRLDLAGDPSFEELVGRVRDAVRRAFDHGDLPFPALVERLEPVRDPSRSPIFQVMFSLQKTVGSGRTGLAGFAVGREGAALRLGDLPLAALPLEQPWSQLDLSLGVADSGGDLSGRLTYGADLFDGATAGRIGRALAVLAAAAAETPERRLSELPVLRPEELHQVLREWSERPEPYLAAPDLLALLRPWRAARPDAVAAVAGGGHLSYGELSRRAAVLAARLRRHGVGPGAIAGLFAERSLDLVVGLHAIFETGAAYLPLDPSYPADRLRFMVEDSGARVVMVGSSGAGRPPALPGVLEIPLAGGTAEGVPPFDPEPRVDPAATAYLIYTSGSTGTPKGVLVPHRAIANLLARRAVDARPDDAMLAKAPISFDVSVAELLVPLSAGGRLVLLPPGQASAPEQLLDTLVRERVTVAALPPSLAAPLVEAGLRRCRSLRAIGMGVETVPPELVESLFECLGGVELYNRYGPTEATVFATEHRCRRPVSPAVVPIGRSTAGAELLVTAPRLAPAPVGVAGEICLGGPGLATGYHRRPGATAERFVPHPWTARAGARLYRTGDRGRFRADGEVEFLGRLDAQVKVRGHRVEPGEVEAAVGRDPRVRAAAVVDRPHPGTGAARLVAYVVPRAGEAGGGLADELRRDLAERLPEFLVPQAIVLLDELPRTANGKVDRRALATSAPEPDWGGAGADVALRGAVEEAVAGLYREVLGVDRVGAGSDFFGLGGHSLLATRLVARLREALGVELPVGAVFEHPTVAGLAGAVEALGDRASAPPPLTPCPRVPGAPLTVAASFGQERLWFLNQLEPGSPAYHLPGWLRFSGPLDTPALAAALAAVVRRHEALRTVLRPGGDGPVQVVLPEAEAGAALPVVDLSALQPAVARAEADRVAGAESRRAFDLASGPLQRVLLARLGERDHRLLLVQHHAVSDGGSVAILLRELSELYRALRAGRKPLLPELAVQYPDFAAWQRRWLEAAALDQLRDWWREELAGAPAVLELPLDRRRPVERGFRGGAVRHRLERAGSQADRLARELGATPFAVWLAAAGALLGRLAGKDEVVLGFPVAGRNRPEVEPVIGFFVNTLVVRVELGGDPSFEELVRRVRERVLRALAHQDLPFERLVEDLAPRRDLARTPLFQAVVAFQNGPRERLDLAGLELEWLEPPDGVAKFDLGLDLHDAGGGLAARLEFDRDLFDATTIRRWAGHLERLVLAAAGAPSRRLSEVPVLGPAERHHLLAEWGARQVPPPERALHEGLRDRIREAPDRVALVFRDRQVSYGELGARAAELASRLRALHLPPEAPVALWLEPSVELVVAIAGVLEAGGAYLPIDPGYPARRVELVLEDSGAPVVLSDDRLAERLPATSARIELVTRSASARPPEAAPQEAPIDPDRLAYVIYTSGSTGKPKGTPIRHGSVWRLFASTAARFGFGPDDAWTLFHSAAFDFSVWEVWGALLHGGRLVVVPHDERREVEALRRRLAEERVSVLNLTPSVFRQLVTLERDRPRPRLYALRRVVFGGEALSLATVAPWFERYGDRRPRLVNMYGITETTVHVTERELRRSDLERLDASPVGRAIGDLRVVLVDARLEPAPTGVAGEICVGGPGLARGYLGRPGLSARRFVPDAWSGVPGERLYRSGDLARLSASGELEYLGRIDHQVKVRGYRIELGEIEAALATRPEVREAVAVVSAARGGDARLVAYVVPVAVDGDSGDVGGLAERLRGRLQERLPEYMVPQAMVVLERLPLTPNGKIDRRALPEPDWGGREGGEHVPPRGPVEEVLAGIYGDLLGEERVGAGSDFFELGGHSLLATRLVSRVRAVFGVELPVRAVFEHPTVGALAAAVAAGAQGPSAPPPLLPVVPEPNPVAGAKGPVTFAPSFGQERLWFLAQLDPGSPAYHLPGALRITGRLEVRALAAALRMLVRRHAALRTVFRPTVARGPVQVVHPPGWPAAGKLPLVDLSSLPEGRRRSEALARVRETVRRPFDLESGPLLRTTLLGLGGGEHLLAVDMHHVVSDGWSIGILVRELGELCAARVEGRRAVLPELPVQYPDFAAWQRRWLQGGALEGLLSWWRRELEGAPRKLELPADRPRPRVQTFRVGEHRARVPEALAAAVAARARALGATPFMVWLGAVGALLGRLAGQDEVVLGSPIAGRTRAETEGLIGFFVNTLVLRVELGGEPRFEELVARVRERALGAYAHQDLPFERLVETLAPRRDLSATPLFQALFAYQNTPRERLELPGATLERVPVAAPAAKFDLTVDLSEDGGEGLGSRFEFNRDLFDPTTVARWAAVLERLVATAVAAPERRVAELPLLSPAEAQQVVVEWNDTAPAWPRTGGGATLSAAVRSVAAESPERVALVAGPARTDARPRALSYGELTRRAAAVAARLRSAGVGTEARVAVCLDRGPDLVAALLGVLEAGGAYVPLDPAYPPERLRFMLEDSEARVVVTDPARVAVLGGAAGDEAPQVLTLDGAAPAGAEERPVPGAAENRLAYVIYTSGSTGRPKGVAIPHAAAGALVAWSEAVWDEELLDGVLAVTSVCFDLSVFELFVPLARGGRVILVDDALAVGETPEAARAVLLNTVPSVLSQMLALRSVPASVRVVNLAGEPLRRSLVEALRDVHPGVERVLDLYGPSEDATYSTWSEVAPEAGRQEPRIGRPIAGTRAYVLDRHARPVPPGVAGELFLAGAGLARGYLGRPARTAAAFVPDPFAGGAGGGRLYRTGDRVRREPDGRLHYLGRLDHQVKLRGYRIELGEVESVLVARPEVREAAAVARGAGTAEGRLVAYVTPAPGAEPESLPERLRQELRERLPRPLVPDEVTVVDALPLTPSGKVDRRALEARADEAPRRRAPAAEPPETQVERTIAAAFAEVLGLADEAEGVGRHEDFFHLGGHSLEATQVLLRMEAAFGVQVPVRRFFESPTVAGLAVAVAEERPAGEPSEPEEASPGDGDGRAAWDPPPRPAALPLSFAQERLWLLAQLDPGSPAYHLTAAVALSGPLRPDALAAALAAVVGRHEALRTVFPSAGSGPVQVVLPPPRPALPVADLAGLPPALRAPEAERQARRLAIRPFDLASGPLQRAALVRLAAGEHRLVVVQHHAVSDGWSVGILLREVSALYRARVSEVEAALAPLRLQYPDFALWQRRRLDGPALGRLLAWWRDELAGAPPLLTLPADRPRPPVRRARGEVVRRRLPAGRPIAAVARELDATPFMVWLALYGALLGRLAGQDDVVVGTPVAGRTHPEAERLIGFFANTLALRVDLAGDPSFAELVARVRERVLAAFARQELPFERLVEELAPQRDLATTPVFQAALAYQNVPAAQLDLPDLEVEWLRGVGGTAKFDLLASVAEDPDGSWTLSLELDRDLFDRSTVERWARSLERLAAQAVAAPGRRISTLPLASAAERHQVLHEWGGGPTGIPVDSDLVDLVAAQAAARPDAVALVAGEEQWTYGELEVRSRRLAAELRRRGAGPEVPVALCLERSADWVMAVVAILRAGAFYVPLDPSDPPRRLELMVKDVGARLLVAREAHAAAFAAAGAGVVAVERCRGADPPGGLPSTGGPDSLAYVMYTSGSTGRPKGVAVTRRSVVRLVRGSRFAGFGPDETFLQLAPGSFDASTLELWGPLVHGGRLEVFPPRLPAPDDLGSHLLERRVTTLWLTAGLFHQMVEERPRDLAGLRCLLAGGDVLSPPHVARALAALGPGAVLVDGYGPTEGTTFTCCHRIPGGGAAAGPVPVGRPISNTWIRLLDPSLEPVPPGVPGELWIGGLGVARGYRGRPGATAERFVPDPFAGRSPGAPGTAAPGSRLYRSGDLARWLADGRVDFLGRLDRQVKVRGFRIEPGEIEAALSRQPGVAEAAVVVCGEGADRRLVGFVVLEETPGSAGPGAPPAAAERELRALLQEVLPAYMVPHAVTAVDRLPLTATGKVDRRALAEAGADAMARAAAPASAPPETPIERALAEILAEVLELPGGAAALGVDDDFFDRGGHSLKATQVLLRVDRELGVRVPLRRFFEVPTISGLALAIAEELLVGEDLDRELDALAAPEADGGGSPG